MAASKVSVLDGIGNPDSPPGSEPWAKWMLGQAKLRRQELQRDVVGLQEIVKKLEKHAAWKALGFMSYGLGRSQCEIDAVIAERKARNAQEMAKSPPVLLDGPGPATEQERAIGSVTTNMGRGSDYLTARIARDHPDVLKRMRAGEFPSVRRAAIEAGIVKVPTPLDTIKRLLPRLSRPEQRELRRLLDAMPPD
jgi:hypothetical protein